LRLTVGRRASESGEVEVQIRRGREPGPSIALADPLDALEQLCRELA